MMMEKAAGKYSDVPLGQQLMYQKPKFDAASQPRWSVPEVVVIEAAISGDHYHDPARRKGISNLRENVLADAIAALTAGASAIHLSAYNAKGGRSGQLEDYLFLVEGCRERCGDLFVVNCNVLFGDTFEEKLTSVFGGLAEESVINCHERFHPRFLQACAEVMEAHGCRPHLTVRDTIEITQARDILIIPGLVRKPYSWLVYPNFDGIPMPNTTAMFEALKFMVDRIREIDPESVIMVGCNGRASIFLCATAMTMGLNVRVGMEDSMWLYPHRDERVEDNSTPIVRAVDMARLLGRRVATGNDYRRILGLSLRNE
jgi:3-keto-5-aminohexanoate cleavage enzyme